MEIEDIPESTLIEIASNPNIAIDIIGPDKTGHFAGQLRDEVDDEMIILTEFGFNSKQEVENVMRYIIQYAFNYIIENGIVVEAAPNNEPQIISIKDAVQNAIDNENKRR